MIGQLSVFDFIDNPYRVIDSPPIFNLFEKYGKVKGLSDGVIPFEPKYLVAFKKTVFGNYKRKICIWAGDYWHSLDGWNYDHNQNIESFENLGIDFDWHTLGTTHWRD